MLPVAPLILVIVPADTERFPHCLPVIVPPPVSVAVNWEPVPPTHMDCAVLGERLTEERLAVTVTVTSFDTVAEPQVGVEVQTIYHVPVPKPAPVGV